MIDLRSQDLFHWPLLKGRLHGLSKVERISVCVKYMNEYYAYLTGCSTQTPIVCKIFNDVEEKCDVMYITLRDFGQIMQNKKIKLKGKLVNIAYIWLNNEKRQEYNGVIYSPKPLGNVAVNYLNTFTGFKYPRSLPEVEGGPWPYASPEGPERGKEALRVYLGHLWKVC